MNLLIPIGCAAFFIAAFAQIASILLAISRFHRRDKRAVDDAVSVNILRPVCGIDNFVEETVRSTFHLDYPHYEIAFCAADGKDPVIPPCTGWHIRKSKPGC
jgi:ceramide glucosyltransferase